MNLSIKLISTSYNTGIIIIANKTTHTLTNWNIILKCKNFEIVSTNSVNITETDGCIKIMPKEWKINIEEDMKIVSEFEFKGSKDFDYEIMSVNSEEIGRNRVEITIMNNTEEEIVIKPGEKHTFSI